MVSFELMCISGSEGVKVVFMVRLAAYNVNERLAWRALLIFLLIVFSAAFIIGPINPHY